MRSASRATPLRQSTSVPNTSKNSAFGDIPIFTPCYRGFVGCVRLEVAFQAVGQLVGNLPLVIVLNCDGGVVGTLRAAPRVDDSSQLIFQRRASSMRLKLEWIVTQPSVFGANRNGSCAV